MDLTFNASEDHSAVVFEEAIPARQTLDRGRHPAPFRVNKLALRDPNLCEQLKEVARIL